MKKIAALYLRLSDEDDRETMDESNSISTQREILKAYISGHEEFADYQMIEFCDDGYSGTNFNRPKIEQLLVQARQGLISCILVKDFSRFGRNYIEVGTYLEQVFPFLGIRFISVNDYFDSNISTYSGEFIDVAFKTLICDLYSKDLSDKITSVRRSKAEQGKFITAYAPYGYKKSKEQKLVIDEETASVVKRIFRLAEAGVPKAHIAQALNLEGIPTPLTLRKQRGEHFPCKVIGKKCVWRTSVISAMLKDQRYTGDAVYGKVKPTGVGSGKDRSVPREQWIIVPDHHDAIVSHELFDRVNAMFTKRKNFHRGEQAPLSGKVRCIACNHVIPRKKRTRAKRGETATYRCPIRSMSDEFGCYQGTIEEEQIEQAVLLLLRNISMALMNLEIKNSAKQSYEEKIAKMEQQLIGYEADIKKLSSQRLIKYESYKDEIISKIEFIDIKLKLDQEIEAISLQSEMFRQEIYKLKCAGEQQPDSVSLVKKYAPFDSLTRDMVEAFVEQIFILKDGTVRVQWKFNDFFLLI